jgi:hypothetical protein
VKCTLDEAYCRALGNRDILFNTEIMAQIKRLKAIAMSFRYNVNPIHISKLADI